MSTCNVVCPQCGKVNAIPQKDHYNKALCGHCKHSLLETKPLNFDSASFDHHVANNDMLVIVDFWAPWCGPCQMMAPAFEEAARGFALKARFGKVNTEELPELGARFGIRSIPTLVAFRGNREVDRVSGALSSPQLQDWVNHLL